MNQVYNQVAKLVGTGATGSSEQGTSVKLSDDGNYLFVGGNTENSNIGAVWFYQKVNGVWTQKQKIVPTGYSLNPYFGTSIAVNPSMTTLIVGAFGEDGNIGAAFVFTFDDITWTQQNKLVGSGYSGSPQQGSAVGLSADADTAIVGGRNDATTIGAAWIFVRNGTAWSQQGAKLVGNGVMDTNQGYSVAITSDGNLAIVGGRKDSSNYGAIWVYLRSAGAWSPVGSKITAAGQIGPGEFGTSLALSGDDQWLFVGGHKDNIYKGAVWIFKRNGNTFDQFGNKLVGTSYNCYFGTSVATNKFGSIVAVGGYGDSSNTGAVWMYAFNGTNFNQFGNKTVANDAIGSARQGWSVSLDESGSQFLFGGHTDDGSNGAAWVYSNIVPTSSPSITPTFEPTVEPTVTPTMNPSRFPTVTPTRSPTMPTIAPSFAPAQAASSQLSTAGIAGIAVGGVVFFVSVILVVVMRKKRSEKPPPQEKSSVPHQLENGPVVDLKI